MEPFPKILHCPICQTGSDAEQWKGGTCPECGNIAEPEEWEEI